MREALSTGGATEGDAGGKGRGRLRTAKRVITGTRPGAQRLSP